MKNHFSNIQSPLKSIDKYKSLEDQKQRYLSNGWKSCQSICAFDAYSRLLSDEDHRRILQLEPFDEWEEWHLKCCHYSLTVATSGTLVDSFQPFVDSIKRDEGPFVEYTGTVQWNFLLDSIERFGHSVVPLGSTDDLLVIGGVAKMETNRHSRAKHVSLISPRRRNKIENTATHFELEGMYQSCSVLSRSKDKTKFIAFGGRTSPINPINACPKMVSVNLNLGDIESKTIEVEAEEIKIEGPEPKARWRHTLQTIRDTLILFGGRNSELEVLDDLWVLNLKLTPKSWNLIKNGISPENRFSHSSTVDGSKMYISGGLSDKFNPLSDIWAYDTNSETWEQIDVAGLLPRYGHTSHFSNNLMILIGGVNTLCNNQPGIGVVNFSMRTCFEFSLPIADPENPIMLHNHSSVLSYDGKTMFIIGGGGNCFSFGSSFNKYLIEVSLESFYHDVFKHESF